MEESIFEKLMNKNIPFAVCESLSDFLGVKKREFNIWVNKSDIPKFYPGFSESLDNRMIMEYDLNNKEIDEFRNLGMNKESHSDGFVYEFEGNPFKKKYRLLRSQRAYNKKLKNKNI